MADPLATYLHDHMAGSAFGADLAKSIRDRYSGEPLGQFASGLLLEIEKDRATLQEIVDRVGKGHPDLKEAAAWLGEKVSRWKLSDGGAGGIGTFEALEALALGIFGKLSLWRALSVIAAADVRLRGVNFDDLVARARTQYAQVEERRLQVANTAFPPATGPGN